MAAKTSRARSEKRDVKKPTEFSEIPGNRARYFRTFLRVGLAALATAAFVTPPEGSIRNGDFLPTVLLLLLFCLFLPLGRLVVKTDTSASEPTKERPRKIVFFPDLALVFFLLFATASYLRVVITKCGDIRFSTNAYWTFVTPPLFYFILRSASRRFSSRAFQAFFALIVSCAVAESAYSLYSYAVVNPAIRAQYLANPEQTLKDAGLYFASDSQERLLFEKRLLESSEPTGTYGLANTLAGLVAPSFVIALLGFVWFSRLCRNSDSKTVPSRSSRIAASLWILIAFTLLLTIILTKSRAAVLATFSGLLLYGLYQVCAAIRRKSNPRKAVRLLAAIFALSVLIFTASVFAGIVDKEVFTEAGKSLGYRLDYWRATSEMIHDYPGLGIGPGEFQSVYARYILPTASEFIADPHNFAFEIAALFGVPALASLLLFLLGIFIVGGRAIVKRFKDTSLSDLPLQEKIMKPDDRPYRDVCVGFFFGLTISFFTSFLLSAPIQLSFYIVAIPPALLVFYVAPRLTQENGSSHRTPIVAGVALLIVLVNLLAAGGIGYPCVSTLIFILSAIVVESSDSGIRKGAVDWKPLRFVAPTLVLSLCVITAAFYTTAFKPRNQSFLFNLDATNFSGVTNPKDVDPYSIDVARLFYGRAAQEYFAYPTEANHENWQVARDRVKTTSPNSSAARESCADWDWRLFTENRSRREFGDSALDFYRESVERSPTDVGKRAKLARALVELGRRDEAVQEAKRALESDRVNPHLDRKLIDEDRRFLTTLVAGLDES